MFSSVPAALQSNIIIVTLVIIAIGIDTKTVSPEGTFCDTVQVPSGAGDMQLI